MPTNVNWTRNRKLKRNIPKKEILFWVEQGYARKSKAEGLRMEKIIARCVGATTGSSSSLIRKQSSWPQTLEKKLFAFHLSFFFFFLPIGGWDTHGCCLIHQKAQLLTQDSIWGDSYSYKAKVHKRICVTESGQWHHGLITSWKCQSSFVCAPLGPSFLLGSKCLGG